MVKSKAFYFFKVSQSIVLGGKDRRKKERGKEGRKGRREGKRERGRHPLSEGLP